MSQPELLPSQPFFPLALQRSAADEVRWFAVYTNSRHEKTVAKHFTDRSIENFVPMYRKTHRWAKRKAVTLELPLFPNYVFIHTALQKRAPVLSVPGVIAIVGCGSAPSPLPDAEIEWLRTGLEQSSLEPYPYLVAGDRVRIRSGVMQGMEGILVRKKNELRLVVTLELIQRSVAVELDCDDVEPVPCRPPMTFAFANVGSFPFSK